MNPRTDPGGDEYMVDLAMKGKSDKGIRYQRQTKGVMPKTNEPEKRFSISSFEVRAEGEKKRVVSDTQQCSTSDQSISVMQTTQCLKSSNRAHSVTF
jgi:hypothetical protein